MSTDIKKTWRVEEDTYYLMNPAVEQDQLDNAVYEVEKDGFGRMYLRKKFDKFEFRHEIFGLEEDFIGDVLKTYQSGSMTNLGILLNGIKGTGKTVTCKILCNKLHQPVIIVSSTFDGRIAGFLANIPQDVTIFIDEYEKIFGQSSMLLTVMDGVKTSHYRKVFLLTTNSTHIEDNLRQRPTRILFKKEFKDLSPAVVEEVVDHYLTRTQYKEAIIKTVSTLEIITIDIVKSLVMTTDTLDKEPDTFIKIFNVKKKTSNYNVSLITAKGEKMVIARNVNCWPSPYFSEDEEGYWLEVNNKRLGRITEVKNSHTLEVDIYNHDSSQLIETVVLSISPGYAVNYAYSFESDFRGTNRPTTDTNEFKRLMEHSKAPPPMPWEKPGLSKKKRKKLKKAWELEQQQKETQEMPALMEAQPEQMG
jgi:hypothetical protein